MSIKRKITVVAKDGTEIKLTPQQKAYADIKATNPTMSLAEVARRAYPNATGATPHQIVNQNENNQSIRKYSNEQLKDAQTFIHSTVNNENAKIRDRLTAAFRVEDRNLGTVVQQIQSNSTKLVLNIDLTQSDTTQLD